MSTSIYCGSIKFAHGTLCAVCCLPVKADSCQVLAVFELEMSSRAQCDPSLHLRLNKSGSLQSSDISEMVFNLSLFDCSTGKYGKKVLIWGSSAYKSPRSDDMCSSQRRKLFFPAS